MNPHSFQVKTAASIMKHIMTHEKLDLVACSWLHQEKYVIKKPFSRHLFSLRCIILIIYLLEDLLIIYLDPPFRYKIVAVKTVLST